MKHFFIVNPAAGKGNRMDRLMDKIHAICRERALPYNIYCTTEVGDASRYVKTQCEVYAGGEPLRFYACGGDGTVNEVVNGAVGFPNVEVAIIPIGTGNDFIRNFGEDKHFFDLEDQMNSEAVPCDLLRCNDKYCVNMINIGFDCEVADRTAQIKRKPMMPSKLAYVAGVAGEFLRMSGVKFRCTLDGAYEGEKKLTLSVFANGSFCGGGFRAAPYASAFDGKMDICFINRVTRADLISLIGNYKKGDYLLMDRAADFFEYRRCTEALLEFDKPQKICIDGEIERCRSLHLSVEKGAIRIVIPKKAASPYAPIEESPLVKELV